MSSEIYEQIKSSIWRTHEMLLKITSEPIALEITNAWLADLDNVMNGSKQSCGSCKKAVESIYGIYCIQLRSEKTNNDYCLSYKHR